MTSMVTKPKMITHKSIILPQIVWEMRNGGLAWKITG